MDRKVLLAFGGAALAAGGPPTPNAPIRFPNPAIMPIMSPFSAAGPAAAIHISPSPFLLAARRSSEMVTLFSFWRRADMVASVLVTTSNLSDAKYSPPPPLDL